MEVTKEFLFGKSPDVLDDANAIATCEIRGATITERSKIFVLGTNIPYREGITVTGDEALGQVKILRKFILPKTTKFIMTSRCLEETEDWISFRFEIFKNVFGSDVRSIAITSEPGIFNTEIIYSSKMILPNDYQAFIHLKNELTRYLARCQEVISEFKLDRPFMEL